MLLKKDPKKKSNSKFQNSQKIIINSQNLHNKHRKYSRSSCIFLIKNDFSVKYLIISLNFT